MANNRKLPTLAEKCLEVLSKKSKVEPIKIKNAKQLTLLEQYALLDENPFPFEVSGNRNELVTDEQQASLIDQYYFEVFCKSNSASLLSNKDKAALAVSCKTFNNFFQPDLNKQAETFLRHVALGEKNEVEAMLKKNPELLFKKGSANDPCGRPIKGTAYQIALGAKDKSPFPDKFDEMVEMIESYFALLPNGQVEMKKQYNEQFPEGFEKLEEARKQRDLKAVQAVFDAIDKAETDKEAEDAVDVFKKYLAEENERDFTIGYHFNEDLFIKALELHDTYFDRFGGVDTNKNFLAAVKVIGSIQCYFPANLAQATCDGFTMLDEEIPLSRSKQLYDGTFFYDPALGDSHSVYSHFQGWVCQGITLGALTMRQWFQALCQQKQQAFQAANIYLSNKN